MMTESGENPTRRVRLEKGEWTIVACLLVLAAGVAVRLAGWPPVGAGLAYLGAGALVGCVTNRIAIRALFDPWPSRRFRLPYTGIMEIERDAIERGIAEAVAGHIITPEALVEEVRRADLAVRLRDEAADRILALAAEGDGGGEVAGMPAGEVAEACFDFSIGAIQRALDSDAVLTALGREVHQALAATLESDECYALVRDRLKRLSGVAGAIGHATGFADYDAMTYKVIDAVNAEAGELLNDPARLRGLGADWLQSAADTLRRDEDVGREVRRFLTRELALGLDSAAARLREWDVAASPAVHDFIERVVAHLDVHQITRAALQRLSTEEVKQLVLRQSRDHLGWLEVWGGVLGGIGGAALWAASFWL